MEQLSDGPVTAPSPSGPPCGKTPPRDGKSRRRAHATSRTKPRQGLPAYTRQPWTANFHGQTHSDDFHWLRDRRNARVQRLLQDENELVSTFFRRAAHGLRRTLAKEMRSRAKLDDASLPTQDRNYWYYTKQLKNEEYPLHCRRPYSLENGVNVSFVEDVCALWRQDPSAPLPVYADEQIILDPNLLQRDLRLDFIEIGDMDISPDESRLAVTLDCSGGREIYTLFVLDIKDVNYRHWVDADAGDVYRAWARDMERKEESIYGSPTTSCGSRSSVSSPSTITMTGARPRGNGTSRGRGSGSFPSKPSSPDYHGPRTAPPTHAIVHRIDMFALSTEVLWLTNTSVLYVAVDEKMRPFQLVHHDLRMADSDPEASVICYEEEDEEFWVGAIGFTADETYVTFSTASTEVSEWYVCPHTPPQHASVVVTATTRQRHMPAAPVARAFAETDQLVASTVWEEAQRSGRPLAPTFCFSRRVSPRLSSGREYELEHHKSLLGDAQTGSSTNHGASSGAWIIVSNARGFRDFALFVLPDSEARLSRSNAEDTLSHVAEVGSDRYWRQLVQAPIGVKLEGVEVYERYLVLSVRRAGAACTLLLPLDTVRAWWRTAQYHPPAADVEPIPFSALVDLSVMLQNHRVTLQTWRQVSNREPKSITCPVDQLLSVQPPVPDDGVPGKSPRLQSLPFTVEASGASTSFSCDRLRLYVGHLVHPMVVYGVQLASSALVLTQLRVEVVNGHFDEGAYAGAVAWVPSSYSFTHKTVPDAVPVPTSCPADEVLVPVYLCWKMDREAPPPASTDALGLVSTILHARRPLLLNVYGSYGDCAELDFSSERLSLLDRDFVWAYAGVRGGGELGIAWRDAGRKLQRATSVNDTISVASYLQDHGYCAPGRLSVTGGSAGGLVVTRAVMQAPYLFHAVVAAVPFVDCLNTLLDASLPLTVCEWSECGNPLQDAEAYELLESLSPVEVAAQWVLSLADNLDDKHEGRFPPKPPRLPHILLESALDDSRVGYWEPMKLMAYLREIFPTLPSLFLSEAEEGPVSAPPAGPDAPLLLHYCDFQNGHAGANGRFQQWEETAREYAFILACQER